MGVFPSHHRSAVPVFRFYVMTMSLTAHTHATLFIEAISLSPTPNQQIGHGIACSFTMKEEPGMAPAAAADVFGHVCAFAYQGVSASECERVGACRGINAVRVYI